MICPRCGRDNAVSKKFCTACGTHLPTTAVADAFASHAAAQRLPFPFQEQCTPASPINLPITCQVCGAKLKEGKKFCVACGSHVKSYSLTDQEPPQDHRQRRWPAGWEPPPIGSLIPPPPPSAGRIFKLVVSLPNLNRVAGVSASGRWGRALLTLGVGLFILPLFDLGFLGNFQPGIGFLTGILGIVLMISGSVGRRSPSSSLSAVQRSSLVTNQISTTPPQAARLCPRCNRTLPLGKKFCPSCGARQM